MDCSVIISNGTAQLLLRGLIVRWHCIVLCVYKTKARMPEVRPCSERFPMQLHHVSNSTRIHGDVVYK